MVTSSRPTDETAPRLEAPDGPHADLIATVAHEIRDPMTSAIGFADMLLRKGDRMSEEERREALEAIVTSGRRLVHLVDELLDMGRIESGSAPSVMRPVDLNEIVDRVLKEQRGRRPDVRVEFEASEDAVVEADGDRVHQVIANLVSNAVKFTTNGAPIRVAVRRSEREAVVAVQDQGVGIAPEDVPKLFGPFVRLASPGAADRAPGSGLGLYISKRIVDAHRGRISVESEPGTGSTFIVALPVSQTPA